MKNLFTSVFVPISPDHRHERVTWADGIRGWASLMVVLWHLIFCFLARSTPEYQTILLRFVSDGFLAVMIFFVLSGYALSLGPLRTDNAGLAVSAASRYFRLAIPVLGTTLIAYLFLKAGLMFNGQAAALYEDPWHWLGNFYQFAPSLGKALRFALYAVFFRYDAAQSYNSSLWTMSIELTGSFLIFGYLSIYRKNRAFNGRVLTVLLAALFFKMTFLACFMFGYLIAELTTRYRVRAERQAGVEKICFVALLAVATISSAVRSMDHPQITCLVATAFVAAVALSPRLQRFFGNRFSHFLGAISFPLYLIQIVVICSWSSYLFITLPTYGLSHLAVANLVLFSSIALCMLSAWLLLPLERISIVLTKRLVKTYLLPDTSASDNVSES